METVRIPCADSAVGNSNTGHTLYDAQYNSVGPCGYIRPAYLSCQYDRPDSSGGGIWQGWVFAALAFRQDDIAFLEHKRIASMQLYVYVVSASPVNHTLLAHCPAGAAFLAGATGNACLYTKNGGTDVLWATEGGLATGWKAFTVPSLAVLKNILLRGVKLEDMGAGASARAWCQMHGHAHSSLAPYIEVQYEDENTPPLCEALEPSANVVDGDAAVSFRWNYQQAANLPQSHVSIWVRKGDGAWQPVVEKSAQSTQEYTAEDGIALRGECAWRVQVFSTGGSVASAVSGEKAFLVVGSPAAPGITGIDTSPRCTVAWQQEAQTGFEVFLRDGAGALVHHSGQRLSAETHYTLPGLLADGAYTVQVRTLNAQMRWGPVAAASTRIENRGDGRIAASCFVRQDGCVEVRYEATDGFDGIYLLRDGVLISADREGEGRFCDWAALGRGQYVVRGVRDGHYVDAPPVTVEAVVDYAQIGPAAGGYLLPLALRRGAPAVHERKQRADCRYVHYEGQLLPAGYWAAGRQCGHTLRFTVEERAVYDGLLGLVGRGVLYKDCEGDRFCGVLDSVAGESGQGGFDVNLSITETAAEVIEYGL